MDEYDLQIAAIENRLAEIRKEKAAIEGAAKKRRETLRKVEAGIGWFQKGSNFIRSHADEIGEAVARAIRKDGR